MFLKRDKNIFIFIVMIVHSCVLNYIKWKNIVYEEKIKK